MQYAWKRQCCMKPEVQSEVWAQGSKGTKSAIVWVDRRIPSTRITSSYHTSEGRT